MLDPKPTTLYRLFGDADVLLYVGIAGNPGRRFEQHAGTKSWWGDVRRVELKHYSDRGRALDAELRAIRSEHPLHNIAGRVERPAPTDVMGTAPRSTDGAWTFHNRRGGPGRRSSLTLIYEVDGTSISDDWLVDEISAAELFRRWERDYVRGDGNVPIYWFVSGAGVFESAPFAQRWSDPEDFLTHYTWPVNDDGERLNWNALPIEDGKWLEEGTKGGFFQQHTGWKPSPFTLTVHTPTILAQASLTSPYGGGR